MAHFYLYLANIVFVLTLLGLFVYLAGRLAYRDGRGLMGLSLHSIGGALAGRILGVLPAAHISPQAQHLSVLETSPEAGIEAGHIFTLRTPLTAIGRSPTNHIVLNDALVSGEHVTLMYVNGGWLVEDQHSRNGTTLYLATGSVLPVQDKPEKFQPGDVLQVGNTRLQLGE